MRELRQEKRERIAGSTPRKPNIFKRTVAASRETENPPITALINLLPLSLDGKTGPKILKR
jgi:hypothetical protein